MTDQDKIKELNDIVRRFLTEGEYNDEGNYVFASDTVETGPNSEPDTMVPRLVLDAAKVLRDIDEKERTKR